MTRDIEVKLLRALVAVIDEGGFSRAAKALHVTQPTVSQQIRRLESIVRAPLLERAGQPVKLTPAGRELLAYARQALLLNCEMIDRISELTDTQNVNFGCAVHLASSLREMLSELSEKYPSVRPMITTGLSAVLAEQVARSELEAAILLGIRADRCEMIGELQLAWYGHAPLLPDNAYPVTTLTGERSALALRILETLSAHDVRWRVISSFSDPMAVRASVEAGLAYTALPANAHLYYPTLHPAQTDVPVPAPAPLPIYLALSPSASEPVADVARTAARAILLGMP